MELPFDDRAKNGYAAGFIAAVALLAWWLDGFVPLLGHVDFGIHELGHLLAFPLPDSTMLLAGSVLQVAVPAGLSLYFWLERHDRVGAVVTMAWVGSSLVNVGVYIADAPLRQLPIIGPRHDWATLLGRWGAMDMAPNIGGLVGAIGFIVIGSAFVLALVPLFGRARTPQPLGRRAPVPDRVTVNS